MLNKQKILRLRTIANPLKPIVYIGQKGFNDEILALIDRELNNHELLKIKFQDFKDQKKEITDEICEKLECTKISIVGFVATIYRQHPDPEKRKIVI